MVLGQGYKGCQRFGGRILEEYKLYRYMLILGIYTGSFFFASSQILPSMPSEPKSESPTPSDSTVSTSPQRVQPTPEPSTGITLAVLPYLVFYIGISAGMIFFNQHVLKNGFPFPITLTCYHMFMSSVLSHLLKWLCPWLFDPEMPTLSWGQIGKQILPIALAFAVSLIFCNTAYLYLSVSFIQMMKASHSSLVYLLSCLVGLDNLNWTSSKLVLMISCGVGMASYGELNFVLTGFLVQVVGSLSECVRLVLTNVLLSRQGIKLDPLGSVYYVAPVSCVVLGMLSAVVELPSISQSPVLSLGLPLILLNGLVAFGLNLAVAVVIKKASALAYVFTGICKDCMIISLSCLFGGLITPLQISGFLVALSGIQTHNYYRKNPREFEEGVVRGIFSGVKSLLGLNSQKVNYEKVDQV